MTAGTVAHQASLSMGFPRQGNWTGLPFPSPGNLPQPGWNPNFLHCRQILLLLLLSRFSRVSVRPHRQQPTRLPYPWDSPGKNTGVGCHFLLQCMKVKVKSLSRVRLLGTPWTTAYQAPLSMRFARQEYWSGLPCLLHGQKLLLLLLSHFSCV